MLWLDEMMMLRRMCAQSECHTSIWLAAFLRTPFVCTHHHAVPGHYQVVAFITGCLCLMLHSHQLRGHQPFCIPKLLLEFQYPQQSTWK
jgi:hypothetical protein